MTTPSIVEFEDGPGPFQEWPKMARLQRDIIITEKIDGTNAQIFKHNGKLYPGSRNRWITPEDDNAGFAKWVKANEEILLAHLPDGRHFGEWWGQGIQRNYGLKEKRFSFFNVSRWAWLETVTPEQNPLAGICHVVPTLYQGPLSSAAIDMAVAALREVGSAAAPGFMNPEGIIVWHTAANIGFKQTLEKDGVPKSLA